MKKKSKEKLEKNVKESDTSYLLYNIPRFMLSSLITLEGFHLSNNPLK